MSLPPELYFVSSKCLSEIVPNHSHQTEKRSWFVCEKGLPFALMSAREMHPKKKLYIHVCRTADFSSLGVVKSIFGNAYFARHSVRVSCRQIAIS